IRKGRAPIPAPATTRRRSAARNADCFEETAVCRRSCSARARPVSKRTSTSDAYVSATHGGQSRRGDAPRGTRKVGQEEGKDNGGRPSVGGVEGETRGSAEEDHRVFRPTRTDL